MLHLNSGIFDWRSCGVPRSLRAHDFGEEDEEETSTEDLGRWSVIYAIASAIAY